ncbi:sodium/hydrogen exchanger family domain-containing protein [Phthorimaea operculella]|nr:sodium/hydrogen exchanger family domain-containing protein [Phthorimaea operculella]
MAKPSKSLQMMAQKLSLHEEEKLISKAAEFERLLQMKSTANNITDIAKVVICLDLAATIYRVDFDQKTAIKCSGLKGPTYLNSRKIIENILELNSDQLTIPSLCLTLQCNVQDLAQRILEEYKNSSKMELDMNMPQYVCMAVYQACRISKIKVPKSKLVDKSQLKPGQWTKLDADWTKFVDEKFATVVKKKRGRPAKNLVIDSPNKHKDTPNKHKDSPNKQKDTANKQKEAINELVDPLGIQKENVNNDYEMTFSPRRSPRKTPLKYEPYKSPMKNKGENQEEVKEKTNGTEVGITGDYKNVRNESLRKGATTTWEPKHMFYGISDSKDIGHEVHNVLQKKEDVGIDKTDSERNDLTTLSSVKSKNEDVELRKPRQADINVPDKGKESDSDIEFDNPSRPTLAYPPSLAFLFIFTTLLIGVIIRCIMLWTFECIPYRVIMFALGGLAGFCANKYPSFRPLVQVCYVEIDVLLITFLPIVVFNTSYSVDSHSFWKSFPQVFLVAVPGVLLTSCMVAFMAYYLIDASWSFTNAFLFGIVCAPIYPMEVVKKLKEMSSGKYVSVLLLGEGLIGDATCMIAFTACFGISSTALSTSSQVFLMLLRYAGGGMLLGILNGKIIGFILTLTYYDSLCAVSVTLAGSYLTYYIGEKYFYVSGLLATVIAGVIVSDKKSTIAGEVDAVVTHFWAIMTHAANTVLFTMVGVVIFEKVSYVITARQVALIFVTYSTVYCSRLILYFMMMPVLTRVGYGLSWQHGLACVWGGLRGPLSLCFALTVLQSPPLASSAPLLRSTSETGELFIVQTAGLVLLSLLINATTMQKVLKLLGLGEISLAKKANMTNCVKRIMMTRDRCIAMLKMDKFLADANWDLVQEGTTIKHPYQLQMSGRGVEDDDLEDDTYMGYRYTTCPDCEREIPNEPTKKEFAEMMREANQRVLKALKISYWRQYEHGKISKDGVRLLVQAVEVAADSDEGKVNLDMLGTLWRPKKHAIWLRRRLIKMMTSDTSQTLMPQNALRMFCYRMVQNFWFDIFIYLVILANTPVILCEVIMQPPVAPWTTYTIKSLNVVFYTIYILEMLIKMIGLGVCGYFKSHWNKLDFVIIVFATGDLVLDVIDATTPWDKWSNLNSSVITATKLLRMLRFLRLCKLARVSIPKIMASIDRMIDIQLAFGYDVGKGFVTGEQEVCTLLPQLVDNKQIQDTITAKLEADRPWTAITVKTRQATTSTLNIMLLDANQLKEEGFLDEMEYRLLVNSIQEKVQQCRHKGSLVAPSSPETQLRSVSWLQGNERVADFFLENSEILNFNVGDILISRGDEPKGIYILVSGLLEASYFPPDSDIDEAIPNYEFLTDLKFNEPSQDYIVSGNAVGVLGQEVKKLTFAKAIEVARQAARARQARELITVKQEPVYRIGQTGGAGRASAGQGRSTAGPRCGICGMKSHQAESCRYKNYRCRSCGVKGHLVKVCKKKGSVRVNNIDVSGATSGAEENDNHKCEECELFNLRSVNYDPIFLSIQINNFDNDELPVVFNDGSNCASSPPLISAETSSPANSSAAQNDDLNTTLMPENILSDSNNETVESEVWEEAVDEDSGGDESLESVTLNEVSSSLEASYFPPDSDIDEAIPNYEFLTDLKFNEPSQDYIVSGNAVGVLGGCCPELVAPTICRSGLLPRACCTHYMPVRVAAQSLLHPLYAGQGCCPELVAPTICRSGLLPRACCTHYMPVRVAAQSLLHPLYAGVAVRVAAQSLLHPLYAGQGCCPELVAPTICQRSRSGLLPRACCTHYMPVRVAAQSLLHPLYASVAGQGCCPELVAPTICRRSQSGLLPRACCTHCMPAYPVRVTAQSLLHPLYAGVAGQGCSPELVAPTICRRSRSGLQPRACCTHYMPA